MGRLQTAYTQLAGTAQSNGDKKSAKRAVRGTEAEVLRQKVVEVHSFAEACSSAVQRSFAQSRGQRFKDWLENVQQSITAAQKAGSRVKRRGASGGSVESEPDPQRS